MRVALIPPIPRHQLRLLQHCLGRFLLFVREITVFAEDTPCQDARLSADAEKKNPIGKSGGGLLPKSSEQLRK